MKRRHQPPASACVDYWKTHADDGRPGARTTSTWKQGSQDELKSFSVQLRGLQLRFRAFGYCKWRGFKETQDSFQSFPNGMVVDGP